MWRRVEYKGDHGADLETQGDDHHEFADQSDDLDPDYKRANDHWVFRK
jgi:hypothetical protein